MKKKTKINREEAKELLYDLYWHEKKSIREIAKIIKADPATVRDWLKYHNIKTRNLKESSKNRGMFKEKHYNWKGGKLTYWGRVARRAWGEYWGEEVSKGYVIHHVDRNKENNDICNLALITKKLHSQIHVKRDYYEHAR